MTIDSHVFSVRVENSRTEFANRRDWVDELHHQVRRVIIETKVRRWDFFEHVTPDCRRAGEVYTKRPSLVEHHRAVFDADLDALIFCVANDVWPHFSKLCEILF